MAHPFQTSSRSSLSIVVVGHRSRTDVLQCLRSLRANSPDRALELIVVDNASGDGTGDAVRAEFPDAQVIERAVNDGFSRANNVALSRATGDYTLLLNPDTLVSPGALDAMVDYMDAHPESGIVGCRLVNDRGETQPSAGGLPGLRMQAASWLGLKSLLPRRVVGRLARRHGRPLNSLSGGYFVPLTGSGANREVEFVSGACMLVRRQVWDHVGPLDEHFFLYLEDADLCQRAAAAGWRLHYLPTPAIVHLGGRSFAARSGGATHHVSCERARSLVYYFHKHGGAGEALLVRMLLVVAVAPRLVAALLRRERNQASLLTSILRVAVAPVRSAVP